MITKLYTVYRAELMQYCCRICGNVSDAEDLLQETYTKALPIGIFWKTWEKKSSGPGSTEWHGICSMMPAGSGK